MWDLENRPPEVEPGDDRLAENRREWVHWRMSQRTLMYPTNPQLQAMGPPGSIFRESVFNSLSVAAVSSIGISWFVNLTTVAGIEVSVRQHYPDGHSAPDAPSRITSASGQNDARDEGSQNEPQTIASASQQQDEQERSGDETISRGSSLA